jgi:glycosyltransferase involved in cell wall biosynthesis
MIRPGVSIIVCCHNGARRLRETIKHIALQEVPSYVPWEFILVDNGSTDDSVRVAKATWSEHRSTGEFRIVTEPQLGLSHARQKGFAEARYEYMILCDDDNWFEKNYVANAYDIMIEKPRIGALGGEGRLVFEEKAPDWIRFSNIFAAGPQAPLAGKVEKHRIYGAGAVIRNSAIRRLQDLQFSSLLSDRKGAELSSGGDHELCYALAIAGYEIWYDPRLKFEHYITKERLTWNYFMRYARESSKCFDVLVSYKMIAEGSMTQHFSTLMMAKEFLYTLREFARISFGRLRNDRTTFEGKLLYFRFVIHISKLIAYFQKFKAIRRNHEKILGFKEVCRLAEEKRVREERITPLQVITYVSKLFQQPQ